MPNLGDRIKHAWNAFRDDNIRPVLNIGPSYGIKPDLFRLRLGNERSIIASVYTRLGIDVASIPLLHVRLDQNGRYLETIQSSLNNCLTLESNIDQSSRAFIQDIVMSMCDEGHVAIVPVDTTLNPNITGSYDIVTMRTGKVVEWYPEHVKVNVYNSNRSQREDIIIKKSLVAIVENPFYAVMNETNSTLQRLISKLNLLDVIDTQSGAAKLDLIIQLPYVIKTETRKQQAEQRKKDIETQLKDSQYGIAYIDGTERVTQLNRPAENNLMDQIEYLTSMLYSQLGLTKEVFDGNADEKALLNYYNRTIEPFISVIALAMNRAFLTKTARSQRQSIAYIRDPFAFITASQMAEVADKFTRNAILSSNEVRGIIGFKPSDQEGADDLQNKNLNPPSGEKPPEVKSDNQNERKPNE